MKKYAKSVGPVQTGKCKKMLRDFVNDCDQYDIPADVKLELIAAGIDVSAAECKGLVYNPEDYNQKRKTLGIPIFEDNLLTIKKGLTRIELNFK